MKKLTKAQESKLVYLAKRGVDKWVNARMLRTTRPVVTKLAELGYIEVDDKVSALNPMVRITLQGAIAIDLTDLSGFGVTRRILFDGTPVYRIRGMAGEYDIDELAALTPAGRAELAAEPESVLLKSLNDELAEIEYLERQKPIDDLRAKLARAEAALREARDSLLDIRDLAKPYELNGSVTISRIVSHAEYGLHHSEDVAREMGMELTKDEAGEQPAPKMTTHRVGVAPSVGDKVRIRKEAIYANRPYILLLQKAGTVGEIVDFDGDRIIVEFEGGAADDGHKFTPAELEIVELGRIAGE